MTTRLVITIFTMIPFLLDSSPLTFHLTLYAQLVGSDYFIPVLTEYVRSLSFYKQSVEHFICKLIIEHLITSNRCPEAFPYPNAALAFRSRSLCSRLSHLQRSFRPSIRYYQLHQFLQYHVIGDSVHVACQLLSVVKLPSLQPSARAWRSV
jgi:hypothetical protein